MRILLIGLIAFTALTAVGENNEDHDGGGNGRGRTTAPETVRANRFNVTRPLGYYGNRLSDEFLKDLAALRADGHWIDGGSGDGVAIEQYHQLGLNEAATDFTSGEGRSAVNAIAKLPANQRAHVTGITYQMVRPGTRTYDNRLRHMVGRFMEDIPDREIGRADLISDVHGVFQYTHNLDIAMRQYLTALKPNGKIYMYANHMDRTTIREGQREISVMTWLSRIEGVRIERVGEGIRITKTGAPISIPKLFFISSDNQTPPSRVFKMAGTTISVPELGRADGPGTDFTVRHRHPVGRPEAFAPDTQEHLRRSLGYDPMEPNR